MLVVTINLWDIKVIIVEEREIAIVRCLSYVCVFCR